jgi:hypothetical protein
MLFSVGFDFTELVREAVLGDIPGRLSAAIAQDGARRL